MDRQEVNLQQDRRICYYLLEKPQNQMLEKKKPQKQKWYFEVRRRKEATWVIAQANKGVACTENKKIQQVETEPYVT